MHSIISSLVLQMNLKINLNTKKTWPNLGHLGACRYISIITIYPGMVFFFLKSIKTAITIIHFCRDKLAKKIPHWISLHFELRHVALISWMIEKGKCYMFVSYKYTRPWIQWLASNIIHKICKWLCRSLTHVCLIICFTLLRLMLICEEMDMSGYPCQPKCVSSENASTVYVQKYFQSQFH